MTLRVPFNLTSVRAARLLQSGIAPPIVCRELGLEPRSIERIETTYRNVPGVLLIRMEQLLRDRERLRSMISTLIRRTIR